jgi:hypothetical protein
MLADPTAQNDHSRLFGLDGHVVQSPDILDDIDSELRLGLVGVEVDHVA